MITKYGKLVCLAALCFACSSEPEPETPVKEAPAEPAEPAPAPEPVQTASVKIAEDIRKLCGIEDPEAFFEYNSARVKGGKNSALDKLVECFTTGKAAGRKMRLVGHADPRGDEEYNMLLGGRRADSIRSYLVKAGLPSAQAESTSRGEMEANGSDEAGWAKDRRVEIVLAD